MGGRESDAARPTGPGRWVRLVAGAGVVAVVLGSAGCTQVAQLRGVAGGQISAVRTATNSALVDAGVVIGTAPTCAFEDPRYVCAGTAGDGRPIHSVAEVRAAFGATKDQWGAPEPADVSLVVTVGDRTVYEGTVEDVLTRQGQVAP